MPVRTPGSSTSASKPKYRVVMARSAAVTLGTPEHTATPVTWSSKLKPWNPRNCWIISASSSDVRDATVAMRQWSARSAPSNRPMTVWVLPVSIASSMASALRGEVGHDVERDVERDGAVRDRTDRDVLRTGVRVGADRLEGDPARDLERHVTVDLGHGLAHQFGIHVVEEDQIGTGRDGLVHLRERVALDLDRAAGPARLRARDGRAQVEIREVVVLDEHGVAQALAVVEPATRAHRGLLDRPQSRQRLAGVAHLRPAGGGLHVLVGRRGDARCVLQQVERGPLGAEDRAQVARDRRQPLVRLHGLAVARVPHQRDGRVDLHEHLGRGCDAREHAVAAGHDVGGAGRVLGDRRDRGEVAEAPEVLRQRPRDQVPKPRGRRVVVAGPRAHAGTSAGSGTNSSGPPRVTNRPASASDVSGKSRRVCVPRLSSRTCADATSARATVSRLRNSWVATSRASTSTATVAATVSRLAASRRTPAPTVIACCSSSRVIVLTDPALSSGATTRVSIPRMTPVGSGASLPARIASTMRGAKTRPSSSELEARRFAPWTPEQAASPHDQSPGMVDAPSRSATIPPER